MNEVKLYKHLVILNKGKNDEKKFYTFYLEFNGVKVRIEPNSFKDSQGNVHSTYKDLVLLATPDLPF